MGTRAVFTFKNDHESFSIYKHWDGYPEGAASFLTNAIPFAWKLPRFEPCDFAAAFIAANKSNGGGDVYMTTNHEAHGDLEYFYEIFQSDRNGQMIIHAYHVSQELESLFYGRLKDFVKEYGNNEDKTLWNAYDVSENKLAVEV